MVFVNMSVFPDELEVRETLPKECFAYQDDMSPRIFTVYYIVFRIIIDIFLLRGGYKRNNTFHLQKRHNTDNIKFNWTELKSDLDFVF